MADSHSRSAQNAPVPARGSRQRIYAVVRRIPRGRVATYGQIARLAGLAGHARQVGYALAALPEDHDVPWHRVINAQGGVSPRAAPGWDDVQRQLLRREGVRFDGGGRTSLARYQWQPRGATR
jgi:methylated-DNA-protein-cysteine methyltransferase-like protein